MHAVAAALVAAAVLGLLAGVARAEGCVTTRGVCPVHGDEGDDVLDAGRFEISLAHRYAKADRHYAGHRRDRSRERRGDNVVNEQRLTELRVAAGFTPRWSAYASIPFIDASWSVTHPTGPVPGPRHRQDGRGLGDIVIGPRAWVRDPAASPPWNVQLGLGVKAPTGDDDARDRFPRLNGLGLRRRPVDVSAQPGDGGWGAVLDVNAYHDLGPVRLFAGGFYLVNPREKNGTDSTPVNLNGAAVVPRYMRKNSVPDQYLFQAGAAVPVWGGLSATLAFRWEGVRRRDLIGGDEGFRRPGWFASVAPGLVYDFGGVASLSLTLPRTVARNRQSDYRGRSGDATFAEDSVLLALTVRF